MGYKKVGKLIFAFTIVMVLVIKTASPAFAQTIDASPPSTPNGLVATPVPPSAIKISWNASTDNVKVLGYRIYRNNNLIVSSVLSDTSFLDGGLLPGVYSYTVTAYDAAGNTSQQSASQIGALISDKTPPSKPTNLTAIPATPSAAIATNVNVSWTAATDNVGIAGYNLYRYGFLVATIAGNVLTYIDSDVAPGTYEYRIKAFDYSGNNSSIESTTISIQYDASPPEIPQAVSARPISSSQIKLFWTHSNDNLGVTGYAIYRNGILAGNASSTSYTDTGLTPNTYLYQIRAYDAAGNQSEPATFTTTLATDTEPPATPANITATAASNGVQISWNASKDNIELVGYYLYRNDLKIATINSTPSFYEYFYTDTSLDAGTYRYQIAAYDSSNNISAQSLPAIVIFSSVSSTNPILLVAVPTTTTPILPATATPPTPSSVTVPVQKVSFNIPLYRGLRNEQVRLLQSFLAQKKYLNQNSVTGFFGNTTEQVVKRFQCDRHIACAGSIGWGLVGVKTRRILNAELETVR